MSGIRQEKSVWRFSASYTDEVKMDAVPKIEDELLKRASSFDQVSLRALLAAVWNAQPTDCRLESALDLLVKSSRSWNERYALGVAMTLGKHRKVNHQEDILVWLSENNYPPAVHELGKLLHRNGKTEDAAGCYQQALSAGYLQAGASYYALKARQAGWPRSLYLQFRARHFAERARSKVRANKTIDEAAFFDDWR
jgi:hypothetical protein